jgi:hypothetical protein
MSREELGQWLQGRAGRRPAATNIHMLAGRVVPMNRMSETLERRWPPRLACLIDQLACPACHRDLERPSDDFRCKGCGTTYSIRDGKIYFVEPTRGEDSLDVIKHRLKRHPVEQQPDLGFRFGVAGEHGLSTVGC